MAQHPLFMKQRNVPDLPQQRVDDVELCAKELRIAQIGDDIQRTLSRVTHPIGKFCYARVAQCLIDPFGRDVFDSTVVRLVRLQRCLTTV